MNTYEDRGMMKWAPYQSLIEQSMYLAEMRRERQKVPKPLISSDRAEEINEILCTYEGEEIIVKIWENGFLSDLEGVISKIDPYNRRIEVDERRIPFSSIINLVRA